jgi:hypothetical protein
MLLSLADKLDVSGNLAQLERTAKVITAQSLPAGTVATTIAAPASAAVRVNLAIDPPTQSVLDSLPVRVAKVMKPLMTRGQDAKARYCVATGKNPFDASNPRWLTLAGEVLIAGGFTKAQLRERYMKEFGWSEGTAFSRVSIVATLFPALRIATITGDRIVCVPSVTGDH